MSTMAAVLASARLSDFLAGMLGYFGATFDLTRERVWMLGEEKM